jgi:hypothetical protein
LISFKHSSEALKTDCSTLEDIEEFNVSSGAVFARAVELEVKFEETQ